MFRSTYQHQRRLGTRWYTEHRTKAAADLGLSRITYVASALTLEKNAHMPVIQKKLEAERAIRATGVPWSVFCPAFAMDVLPMHIQGSLASYFGKQKYPFRWLAADDFGRMVAQSYQVEETLGKRLFIYGPESLSIKQALEQYCAVLHPDIKKVGSLPNWLARIIATVIRNEGMKIAVEVYSMYEALGGEDIKNGDPAEANELLGAPSITLGDWLTRAVFENM